MITFSSRLLKNLWIKNWRLSGQWESLQSVHMAFKHYISSVTDLAANFSCDHFRIMPEIIFKLLLAALWSGCAVDWNLNTCPFLGQVVNLDLLLVHRIWSTTCWFVAMPCFYSRTNQYCFGQKQVVAEICFQLTLSVVINQNLQSIKTLLTLELSQYNKSGSTFPGCGQQTLLLT